jgi:hypothetical protein
MVMLQAPVVCGLPVCTGAASVRWVVRLKFASMGDNRRNGSPWMKTRTGCGGKALNYNLIWPDCATRGRIACQGNVQMSGCRKPDLSALP